MAKTLQKAFINLEPVGALPVSDIDEGDLVYVSGTGLYVRQAGSWQLLGSGGGGGDSTKSTVNQTAHGFTVGQVLRHNGTSYVLAQANTGVNAEAIGIIVQVIDANSFVLLTGGYFDTLSGLTPGEVYFLSAATAGATTITEPSVPGEISKPLFVAISATAGFFLNYRGLVVPSLGGGGTISLSNLTVNVPSPTLEFETTVSFPGLTSGSKVGSFWGTYLPTDLNEAAEEHVYVMLIPSTDNLTIRLCSRTSATLFGDYKLLIMVGV